MAPAVPAYQYFRSCLKNSYCVDDGTCVSIDAELVEVEKIPQCFTGYNRVKEMVS